MSQTPEFYLARAEASAAEARSATLKNVRERALRSEAAWHGMAARALRIEREKKAAEEERTARRQAEAAEAAQVVAQG